MTLLTIAAIIGVIAGLGYAYYLAIEKLNDYSVSKYGYEPITWGKAFLMVTLYALLLISLSMSKNGQTDNLLAAALISIVATILLFGRIVVKSSILVAIGSILLLLVGGVLIVVYIAFVLLGSGSRRRYYDDW